MSQITKGDNNVSDGGEQEGPEVRLEILNLRQKPALGVGKTVGCSLIVTLRRAGVLKQNLKACKSKLLLRELLDARLAGFRERLLLHPRHPKVNPILADRLDLADNCRVEILEHLRRIDVVERGKVGSKLNKL